MSKRPQKIEPLVLSIATNQFKVPLPTGKEVVAAVNERPTLRAEIHRLREAANKAPQPAPDAEGKRFHIFDGMTWPLVDAPLVWRLRYAPESVGNKDKMYLASVVGAYEELINCGREKRERVTKELRLVARAALADSDTQEKQ